VVDFTGEMLLPKEQDEEKVIALRSSLCPRHDPSIQMVQMGLQKFEAMEFYKKSECQPLKSSKKLDNAVMKKSLLMP
jgi:hypothetical protein